MKKRAILTAVLIGLSIFDPSYGAAQTRLRTSIELSGETARIPASEVIPNFTTSTSYGIDYLEYLPPHRSFADRAAEVQSTLGGLCHVGRIPGSRLEIAQSCPAERGKKDRIKAWRDFYNAQGEAPIPNRSEVYLVHDRRWFYPVVERELKNGDKLKNPLSLSLSPACAFPNPARGERITELCARSIPVQVPPFAAKIEGSDLILTRLQSAPASAYLTFSAQGREVARVAVRVEAPVVVSPQPPSAGVGASPCPPGQVSVNYKYIDKDLDGYYAPAPLAPGKDFASVCLLQGARLPYLDPVTRTWYAMTTGGSGEDARCDGDGRGQVYVDLPRYWADRDLDGYFAEYVTPVKGCIGRPTATNYLGYLQTPGQPSMRIMARSPVGATEPQSTDRDPTKPAFPNAPGPNPQGPNPQGPNPQGPNRPDPTICNDPNALNHGQELPCLYPTCGDGKVEGNEECDPEVPDDKTCRQCCLPDSTKNECQCVWRPWLCTENDPCISNPTGPGCDQSKCDEKENQKDIEERNKSIEPKTDPVGNMKEKGFDQVLNALKVAMCGTYNTLPRGNTVKQLNIAFHYNRSFIDALDATIADADFFSSIARDAGINSELISDERLDDSDPEKMKPSFLRDFRSAISGVNQLWLTYAGHGVTTPEGRWAIQLPLVDNSGEFRDSFAKACLPHSGGIDKVEVDYWFSVTGNKSESEKCQAYRCGDYVVTADELLNEVKAAGVKDLFFIIDACFSGAFEKNMQDMQASGLNIVSLMSSKACEFSHEGSEGNAGNFRTMVQNLLAARDFTDLNKDDQITLAELVFRVHTEGKNQDAINSIFGTFSGHLNDLCPGQAPQAAVCLDKNLPFLHRVITSWNSECPGASW